MPENVVDINKQTKPTAKRLSFAEVGRTGLRRFSGILHEEFLRTLIGQAGIKIYREMSDNDPIVGSCLLAIEQMIRKTSWVVEPPKDDKSNLAMSATEFVASCMNDMSHSWRDMIGEQLSFLTYGWEYSEIVYKKRGGDTNNPETNSKFSDGLIGWRKISSRLQSTLDSWEFDDEGGIQAMTQIPPPDYKPRTIPITKALLFRTKINGNNPEGRSVLRNAYRSWYFKLIVEETETIGIERDLIGLPVFTPPENIDILDPANAEFREYIGNLIASLRRDEQEGLLIPFGWEVTLLGSGATRRQFDLDKTINRLDKRIAISLLAQFIMLGMDRVGSFALSRNQNDLLEISVQGYLDTMAQVYNSYAIPRLLKLNPKFALFIGNPPRLIPGSISVPNLSELAQYINVLAQNAILPTEDRKLQRDLRRIGQFDDRYDPLVGVTPQEDLNIPKPIPKPVTKPLTEVR